MLRIIRHALLATVGLAVVLLAVLLARPQWLVPALADLLLPSGWHLDELTVVADAPRLPSVRRLVLSVGGCRLLAVEDAGATLRWNGVTPALDVVQVGVVEIEPACLPAGPGRGLAPLDPPGWALGLFPGTRLQVDALVVAGWLPQPHGLAVRLGPDVLEAKVDGPLVRLAGRWRRGEGMELTELASGRAQVATGAMTLLNPRLELVGPAQLDSATRRVAATVRLAADRLNLGAGGKLESPVATVRLDGPVEELRWSAEATAEGIGPVRAEGSWQAGVLGARLSLQRQGLRGLRPLLPPTLPVELEAGEIGIETTLTWAREAPAAIRLEGELGLSDGRLRLTHAVADGVSLRLPFAFADGVWHFGGERAGQLSVGHMAAAVDATAASARIGGSWPASARSPLWIEDLRLRALGGEVTAERLELPQRGTPAILRLRGIRLEEVSALYGDAAVSLSGTVDADLPLHLEDTALLVEEGQIRNATPLRVRLTNAAALDAFKAGNPTLAQAADWLADLEVDHLEGTVNLRRDGALLLATTIEGRNPTQGDRVVRLNYRHEENLLHLLQSLRIGSDLSRGIERRLSPESRRR